MAYTGRDAAFLSVREEKKRPSTYCLSNLAAIALYTTSVHYFQDLLRRLSVLPPLDGAED
jgi:hypothetical protein